MEVHAELLTRSKMFCGCEVAFGGEPNTRTCPVCLGLPGALPVPNREAARMVLRTALALNCHTPRRSVFHRKNYFYPDLAKGYQISQYEETNPLGYKGWLDVPGPEGTRRIHIRRVHLEEDTGKLMHLPAGGSGVDFNRSGVPLMEIVTDFPPDIQDAETAKEYLVQLRAILVYLGVCDGKMEEGSLRCEPNISVRPIGSEVYGTKTEIKNLSSFRSVQLGVQYEIRRQIALIESGSKVLQETRGWNEQTETSFSMRVKESENDYRYFADPDLVPMAFTEEEIEALRASLPELPLAKSTRYRTALGLSEYDANWLVADREWADYFEEAVAIGGDPKAICNWMSSDFAMLLKETGHGPRGSKVAPAALVELTELVAKGTITGKVAKEVFKESFATGRLPAAIVADSGKTQITDRDTIAAAVGRVLEGNPDVVAKYRSGNTNVMGFLVGETMKATQGRAHPGMVREVMLEALSREDGS